MIACPKCSAEVEEISGKVVYPNWPPLHGRRFLACLVCDVRAPLRNGKLAASLADGHTRRLRQQAHAAFDPIWKGGSMSRSAAYAWLRNATGMTKKQCHMAWMSAAELSRVIDVCRHRESSR